MTELILGLGCIAAAAFLYRWIFGRSQYSKSIYQAVYSGYLEFWMKKKKIRKLSESSVFQEKFGKHRLFYQIFSQNKGKDLQPYLVVILESGFYYIRVIRQQGVITGSKNGQWTDTYLYDKKDLSKKKSDKFPNPLSELSQFGKKMQEKLDGREVPVFKLAVFPDQCTIKVKPEETAGVRVINRSQMVETIREIHEKEDKVLDGPEIDAMWQRMAKEALEMEKGPLG